MVKSHLLVASFIAPCNPGDTGPVIDELRSAHAAVSKELNRLAAKHPWPVVLTELSAFVTRYRMPVLDGMRDRNSLPDTFAAQCVREIVG